MLIKTVQYVNIKDICDVQSLDYEEFSTLVTNDFSWGDTDIVLVSKDNMLSVLLKRENNAIKGYAYAGDTENADADALLAGSLIEWINQNLPPYAFINIA